MNREGFTAASEAIDNALHVLAHAEKLGSRGLHVAALKSLRLGRKEVGNHLQTIYDLENKLAAVSDGEIRFHGPEEPIHFSNYHRAALQLWLWVDLTIKRANVGNLDDTTWKVPSDLIKRYQINVSQLSSNLQRERGRLLESGSLDNSRPVIDDSQWPRQADVAKRLGLGKMEVNRLCASGKLRTNGKKSHESRVDPASVLAYCDENGLSYNET